MRRSPFIPAADWQRGLEWRDILGSEPRFSQLVLLDQVYHAISDPDSSFEKLEADGVMTQRLAPRVLPGQEPEPYLPDVGTRALARARFIREHQGRSQLVMAWNCAGSGERAAPSPQRPFAREYEG